VCLEDWDPNENAMFRVCCCCDICKKCEDSLGDSACPLCRTPIPASDAECLARLRQHVEGGVPAAIRQLGYYTENGDLGLAPSPKRAARLYARAVALGDVEAMVNLGVLHEHGLGVRLDYKKMTKYFRMAADRGDAMAICNLGNSYRSGQGVPNDQAEAARCFRQAADMGYTDAQRRLGIMYECGHGVDQDMAEAMRWFERAAARGDHQARANLDLARRYASVGGINSAP
jgi:hypothetical protein